MDLLSVGAPIALQKVTEWIPKAIEKLSPYKPEIRDININYLNRTLELGVLINVPNGTKRRIRDIPVPNFQNCRVDYIRDDGFNMLDLSEILVDSSDGPKIKSSNLPSRENYFMLLKGKMPKETLDTIVFVKPALNKDRKDGNERYWLSSMIRNVSALEDLSESLEVDEVLTGVDIGVEKHLSTNLPDEVQKGLDAIYDWSKTPYTKDWNDVWKGWNKMKMAKHSKLTVDKLFKTIGAIVDTDFFSEFVEIENPYFLGQIKNEEPHHTIPKSIHAQALTRLNLKNPSADGYMTFKKNDYIDSVKEKYDEILE